MDKVIVSSSGSTNGINVLLTLREAGIATLGIDANPDAVQMADETEKVFPANHPDFADLLKSICSVHNTRTIIPTHSKDLIFYADKWRAWQNEGFRYMVSPTSVIRTCDDKLELAQFLYRNGISHPMTYSQAPYFLLSKVPIFAKLKHGTGSVHATLVQTEDELRYYDIISKNIPIYQEYVEGPEYTVNMLSDYNGKVVGAVPIRRLVVRSGLSVLCESEYYPAVEEIARDTAEALELVGPSNVQVIVNKSTQKPVVIEVNPRFASGSLPTAILSGLNIPLLILELLQGNDIKQPSIKYGVRVVRHWSWRKIR